MNVKQATVTLNPISSEKESKNCTHLLYFLHSNIKDKSERFQIAKAQMNTVSVRQ